MQIKKNIAVSDSGFVFDPTSGESYTLNTVGVEIINLLKAGLHEDEIKHKILEEYEVSASAYDKSFIDFVAMLKNYELVEYAD